MTLWVVLWHYLSVVPHLILLGTAVLLWRRGENKKYPIFFAYLIYEFVQFLILYPMELLPSVTGHTYFVAFSVGNAISVTFHFGLIHEIFAQMSSNYPVLARFGKPMFRWATVFFLWLALLTAYFVRIDDPNQLVGGLLLMRRTADILQCGVLLVLFAFSSYFGVSWKTHTFGIALGLGILATAGLVESSLRAQFSASAAIEYGLMAVYHVCAVVWVAYLWLPERVPQFSVKTVPEHDLESWNKELQRLIQQ